MFLCWGESDLSIAFSTHTGSQASSRGEAKDTALLSSRDGYILVDGIIDSMDISLSKFWEIVRQESLVCYSPWGCKDSDMLSD